jgi:hypothetical protein
MVADIKSVASPEYPRLGAVGVAKIKGEGNPICEVTVGLNDPSWIIIPWLRHSEKHDVVLVLKLNYVPRFVVLFPTIKHLQD